MALSSQLLPAWLKTETIRIGLVWQSDVIHPHVAQACGDIDNESLFLLTSQTEREHFLSRGGPAAVLIETTSQSQPPSEIVEGIRQVSKSCAIILCVTSSEEQFRQEALRAGVQDVIVIDETPAQAIEKIIIRSVERESSLKQRRSIERELQRSVYFTNKLLNEIGTALIRVSPEGVVIWWNETAERLTGIPFAAAAGQLIQDLDAPFVATAFSLVKGHENPTVKIDGGEAKVVDVHGDLREVRLDLVPLVDQDDYHGWLIHAIDITDLRRSSRRLEDSNEVFRQLTENIDDIFWVYDLELSRWLYVSPSYERIWGRPNADLDAAPDDWCELLPPERRTEIMTQILLNGGEESCDSSYTICRADGSTRQIRDRVFPIRSGTQGIRRIARITSDVTDKLEVQEQLDRAQKLEAIGRLAAGIAHEINTPTQYVSDNVRFIRDSFDEILSFFEDLRQITSSDESVATAINAALVQVDADYLQEEVPKALSQTLDGLQRISKIVGAMKDFSHPGVEGYQLTDINSALETTATISRNEWKYVAELEFNLAPDLPVVSCLPSELNQVFLNMIVNAAHAIIERRDQHENPEWIGKITISTTRQDETIEISIADSGSGIPEANRKRIFDLFFTTKPIGKGTGQGLALCHAVVTKKHHGTIDLESTLGTGSTFTITLPITQPTDAP